MALVLNLVDAAIIATLIHSFTEEGLYDVQRGAGVYIRHIEALSEDVLRLKSEDPMGTYVLSTHKHANVSVKLSSRYV